MPEAEIGKAVQLLDLMLEFFADDGHWARGCYDDGNGGHCLVGALLHLSRTLAGCDAMPRPSPCALQRSSLRQPRRAAFRHRQGAVSRVRRYGKSARRRRGEDLAARPDRATTDCHGGSRRAVRPRTPRRLASFRLSVTTTCA